MFYGCAGLTNLPAKLLQTNYPGIGKSGAASVTGMVFE
jgi:hypothetical protein